MSIHIIKISVKTYLIHIVANLQVLMSCTYNTLSGIFRLPELRKGSWEPYGESLYPSLIPPFPPPPPPPPLPSPCKYWIWSWYEREGTAILFYTIVHVLCTVINRHLARLIILYIGTWIWRGMKSHIVCTVSTIKGVGTGGGDG